MPHREIWSCSASINLSNFKVGQRGTEKCECDLFIFFSTTEDSLRLCPNPEWEKVPFCYRRKTSREVSCSSVSKTEAQSQGNWPVADVILSGFWSGGIA